MYLAAKPSGTPVSPRQTLVVFEHLSALDGDYAAAAEGKLSLDEVKTRLPEATYEERRTKLYAIEAHILRVLGFDTRVAHPYTLCITYLQTLDVFHDHTSGSLVAKRAYAHLNTALLSPQRLFLTHQPSALATAAIYLAARDVGVPLPETEWWEVFDTDRETLGFLAVALLSVKNFAVEEERTWKGRGRGVPMTVGALRAEMER